MPEDEWNDSQARTDLEKLYIQVKSALLGLMLVTTKPEQILILAEAYKALERTP